MEENQKKEGWFKKLKDLKSKFIAFAATSPENENILKRVKFEGGEVITTDGGIIVFDGDALAEGMEVMISVDGVSDPIPVTSGDYTLQTGEVITIENNGTVSVVTKIVPATPASDANAPAAPAPTSQAAPAPDANAGRVPAKTVESHVIESYFSKVTEIEAILSEQITAVLSENKTLKDENEALKVELEALKKTPVSTPAKTVVEMAENKNDFAKKFTSIYIPKND